MRMRLLRVTAALLSPVVSDHDLHLDAMLAFRRTVDIKIPLIRVRALGHQVWMSTAWDLPIGAELIPVHLTSRKDAEDIVQRARAYTPNSGPGRNRMVRRMAIASPSATWHVCGNRREVRKALAIVDHIGSMRRHGYGRVGEWAIEDIGDPRQLLTDARGQTLRHIPAGWVEEPCTLVSQGAYRAPYWHPGSWSAIVRSGVSVTLRPEVMDACASAI